MDFFRNLFGQGPDIPSENKAEVNQLVEELLQIGKEEDFLSEHPGGLFNGQCHHVRARAIGRQLYQIGGLSLMQTTRERVRKKLGANLATHLCLE